MKISVFSRLYRKYYFGKLKDYFQYDLFSRYFRRLTEEAVIPQAVEVMAEYDSASDSYFAEALHLKGIFTSAPTIEQTVSNINIQLFEYFFVPKHLYRKIGNYYKPPEEVLQKLKEAKNKKNNKSISFTFPAYKGQKLAQA
jgi:hypothetical protein